MYDELDLDMLGDERTALFLIMSDTDGTFAFLISLIYSILFNRLCELVSLVINPVTPSPGERIL